jgi:DNA-directed RNA polymerase alpha subunit
MENESNQTDGLFEALQNDKHKLLAHLLSRIEREAIRQKYSSFEYLLNNTKIQISTQACKQLRQITIIKIGLFTKLLNDSALYLVGDDARIQMFLDTPIEFHNFPTRIFHTLKQNDCSTMRDVIELGHRRVSHFRNLGKAGMQHLDELLKRYECDFLFV